MILKGSRVIGKWPLVLEDQGKVGSENCRHWGGSFSHSQWRLIVSIEPHYHGALISSSAIINMQDLKRNGSLIHNFLLASYSTFFCSFTISRWIALISRSCLILSLLSSCILFLS